MFGKISGWISKTDFYGSKGDYWRKKIFWSRNFFSIFFRLSAKDFRASGNLSEVTLKLRSMCAEDQFGKKLFLRKKNDHFRFFNRKFSDFWQDVLSWMSKTSFYVSRRRVFWGNKNLRRKNNLFLSRLCERCFQSFAQKFLAESSQLCFTYPVDQFEEKFFLGRSVSSIFPDFEQEVSGILRRVFSAEKSNGRLTCRKGGFKSKFFRKLGFNFTNFMQKKFKSIVKTFGECCQN